MGKTNPPMVFDAEEIARFWENAAKPEDYSALRVHSVTQEGQPAGLPADVVAMARAAAEKLGARRRRGSRKPAGSDSTLDRALDAIDEVMDLLEVPNEAYDVGRYTVVLHVSDDEAGGYPPMPPGYGFKGGVARKALARTLRLPISTAAVRDIDLLRAAETPPQHDRELSERYMTEDLIHGNAKVEAITTPKEYFTTREVTVNQIMFLDGAIRITPLGLLDTLGGIIRVTPGHLSLNRGRVHPIVAFKVLRFAANQRAEGRSPLIKPFRVSTRRYPHPFAFFFALQLSRAFEGGIEVADHYVQYARDWDLLAPADLPDDITAAEAAEVLKERLTDYELNFVV